MSETRTYPVTQPQIEAIAAKLQAHGFTVDPHQAEGSAAAQGFQFSWIRQGSPDPNKGTIAITLTKHPFAMGSLFWSQIEKEIGEG